MLQQLDEDLWVAQQPFNYFGLEVGTRMTVIRLSGKSGRKLAIISPIEITKEIGSQIDAIGSVAHIIAPNLYHHLYAGACKSVYSDATLWGAPGLKEKRPELAIDGVIRPGEDAPWQDLEGIFFDGLKTLGPNGFDTLNEWVFLHSASRTLILTDAAFYYDSSFPWTVQLATRVLGSYDVLKPSVLEKIAIRDKQTLKRSVEAVLEWDFDRVVMAHGRVIEKGGKEMFRKGYRQFLADTRL